VYVCNNAKFIELRIFFCAARKNGNSLYNGKNMENDNLGDQNLEDSIKKLDGNIFHVAKMYELLLAALFLAIMLAIVFAAALLKNMILALVPFYAAAVAIMYLKKMSRNLFMQRFALLASFDYQSEAPAESLDAPYLQMGLNRSLQDIVSGTYQSYPLQFFNYNCVVGSGKSRHTITFTAARIGYKATLSRIFLDAHHHYFTEDAALSLNTPFLDKNEEFIKLEGDFNKYFTLYAPKGYEIETLQILTPDIMEDLIAYSKNFSLEFYGSNLYIYSRKVITSGKDLCQLYDLVKFLAAKVAPELERIK